MPSSKLVRDVEGFAGKASLYRLSEVIEYGFGDETTYTEYVIASTANAPFTGIETYIFPADEGGNILDWGELPGSQRGTTSHAEVLSDAGYPLDE